MDKHAVAKKRELAHPGQPELLPVSRMLVSEQEFQVVVQGALEAVGGRLMFKMLVGSGEDAQHVAAASVGTGAERQFLLLTLPAGGGQLKVETAARSNSPLARIAASYAGLMDAFKAAA